MTRKVKQYREAELIEMFSLTRLTGNDAHPLMQEWTNTSATLNPLERYLFDDIYKRVVKQIVGWYVEMLKMTILLSFYSRAFRRN